VARTHLGCTAVIVQRVATSTANLAGNGLVTSSATAEAPPVEMHDRR